MVATVFWAVQTYFFVIVRHVFKRVEVTLTDGFFERIAVRFELF